MVDAGESEKRKMKGERKGEGRKKERRKGEGKLATQNEKEDIRPYPTKFKVYYTIL